MARDILSKALYKITVELQKEDPNAIGWIENGRIIIETIAPEELVNKLIEKYLIEDISLEVDVENRQQAK